MLNLVQGSGQLVAALDVMQQLHRLLLVKYSAYFWSSSPLHPWPTGPSTAQTLAGDERLRTTWFDVFTRYEGFRMSLLFDLSPTAPLHPTAPPPRTIIDFMLDRY